MKKKLLFFYQYFVFLISFIFLFTSIPFSTASSLSFPREVPEEVNQACPREGESITAYNNKLSPAWITVDSPLWQTLSLEWTYQEMMYLIAKYYFSPEEKNEQKETLKDFLKRKISGIEAQKIEERLSEVMIDLNCVKFEKETVSIPFIKNGKNCVASVSINKEDKDSKYKIEVTENIKEQDQDSGNDLSGKGANNTDPIVSSLIKEGKIIEIYLNEDEELKANKVKWIADYVPMLTPANEYLGQEIDLNQIFTVTEQKNMKEWLKKNKIKFRSIFGETAIKWTGDIDTSNISHAGPRDNVIYLGNLLLRFLFTTTEKDNREKLLDNYELKKIKGLYNNATGYYYEERLSDISPFISSIEGYKQIILKRDVKGIYELIERYLQDDSGYYNSRLLSFLAVCNEICLIRHKTTVENRYPIKHAISLLSKEKQTKLVNLLISSQAAEYRNMILVDDILMMLDKTQKLKNWIEVYAFELNNRALWMISPEIWHEAGGLARVMQYHSTGMHNLLKGSGVRLKTLEFQYQYRIDTDGKPQALDYTKDLTHSFKDLKKIDEFTIVVGRKEIKVEASYGENDLGIEGYFLRDVQQNGNNYYCHSLYNYRDSWIPANGLPTWEEFSVFASKASNEFLKRFSRKEKNEIEKTGKTWEAPFCHFNDSQLSLAVIYHRMELDIENEKKHRDENYEIDPVISGMVTGFTSHTYGNRKDYPLSDGYGYRVMEFMEVSYECRGVLKHIKDHLGEIYDMASGALRLSDWQGMVSEAQLNDLGLWDEWINDPSNQVAKKMKEDLKDPFLGINIIAVSNGDNREATAEVFREIIKEISPTADVENLTIKELKKTRQEAKKRIQPDKDRIFYTSKQDNQFLDSNQIVMSYSGRLVPVKVDIENAFTYHNVEELVKQGVQIVIYGNRQTNNPESDRLVKYFIDLVNYLKGKNCSGRLIFMPRFSLKEERRLKAASDVGIHSSRAKTEAAGQTETNDTACYGLVIAPPRVGSFYNGGIGEGLFQRQGLPLNPEVIGEGNTIVPKTLNQASYMEVFQTAINLWNQNKIEPYQITSNRLGRVLEADSTSAEYLRQFNSAIMKKRQMDTMRDALKKKEIEKMETRSLYKQVYVPDSKENPKECAVYKITELVTKGKIDEARVLFFTSKAFQGLKNNLDVPEKVLNELLDVYARSYEYKQWENGKKYIKDFINVLKEDIIEFTGTGEEAVEVAQIVQIMAGQALNIISWIDRNSKDPDLWYLRDLRLTIDEELMIKNEKYGRSFLNARIRGLQIQIECQYGFFWRGFEGIKKLGKNVLKNLIYDKARFKNSEKKFVQYVMDHFSLPLNPKATPFLKKAVEKGLISQMHETFFMHSVLPGATQVLSTGAGHLQAQKLDTGHVGLLDVKHVTEGNGFQVNVRYNAEGKMVMTKIRKIKKGDVCVSLPGWMDYMIGDNLRFNDFSVSLAPELAKKFDINYDEKQLEDIEKALVKQENYAPYIGMKTSEEIVIIENPLINKGRKEDVNPVWEKSIGEDILRGKSLINVYNRFESMEEVYGFVERLAKDIRITTNPNEQAFFTDYDTIAEADTMGVAEPSSLGKMKSIDAYIDNSETFLRKTLSEDIDNKKLIRIPIELLKNTGADKDIKKLLLCIQSNGKTYIELFSKEDSTRIIEADEYRDYGITKKDFSKSLCKENRNRANTITLFPVEKGEQLPASENNRYWVDRLGGQPLDKTIISPVGVNFDQAGLVRGVFLGLALCEIAANEAYVAESNFVSYKLAQYLELCLGLGQDAQDLKMLSAQDLVNIARGDINVLVESLNKLIKCLPIMPFNIEEKRAIYEHAREVWVRA